MENGGHLSHNREIFHRVNGWATSAKGYVENMSDMYAQQGRETQIMNKDDKIMKTVVICYIRSCPKIFMDLL